MTRLSFTANERCWDYRDKLSSDRVAQNACCTSLAPYHWRVDKLASVRSTDARGVLADNANIDPAEQNAGALGD